MRYLSPSLLGQRNVTFRSVCWSWESPSLTWTKKCDVSWSWESPLPLGQRSVSSRSAFSLDRSSHEDHTAVPWIILLPKLFYYIWEFILAVFIAKYSLILRCVDILIHKYFFHRTVLPFAYFLSFPLIFIHIIINTVYTVHFVIECRNGSLKAAFMKWFKACACNFARCVFNCVEDGIFISHL